MILIAIPEQIISVATTYQALFVGLTQPFPSARLPPLPKTKHLQRTLVLGPVLLTLLLYLATILQRISD